MYSSFSSAREYQFRNICVNKRDDFYHIILSNLILFQHMEQQQKTQQTGILFAILHLPRGRMGLKLL